MVANPKIRFALLRLLALMLIPSISLASDAQLQAGVAFEPLMKSCVQCHGDQFEGRQQRRAPRLAGLESWYLIRQLINFKAGVRGSHIGDGYGMQMNFVASMFQSENEIKEFAEYITAFKPRLKPATVTGNVKTGKKLYATCAACHGPTGEGNAALGAPRLAGQSDWYLVTQLKHFKTGKRGSHRADTYGKLMAASTASLTLEQSIKDVVAYINSFE